MSTNPTIWVGFPGALFHVRADPPRARTAAADRTRTPRWRAGTRRTKRRARRYPGSLSPMSKVWADWTDLGWICIDETVSYAEGEHHAG